MENYLAGIVIGLAVLVLVVRAQLRPTLLTPRRTYLMPMILAAYGIGMVIFQEHGRFLDPAHRAGSVLLLVAELVAGVLLGVGRGLTVTVWRDDAGAAWRRGNVWTVVAWIASVLVRAGFVAGGALLGIASGTGLFMVFFAVSLLAQNLYVDRRACAVGNTVTVQA